MSVVSDRIVLSKKKKETTMSYNVNLETFNGSVKVISLPSKGAVAQFISTYPNTLPVGVSVKLSCDALGVRGTLRGKAVL
jgi:plastocyanin domain-containing protein